MLQPIQQRGFLKDPRVVCSVIDYFQANGIELVTVGEGLQRHLRNEFAQQKVGG